MNETGIHVSMMQQYQELDPLPIMFSFIQEHKSTTQISENVTHQKYLTDFIIMPAVVQSTDAVSQCCNRCTPVINTCNLL